MAIILGGAAGVGFLVICLLFARNLLKKHDGMCYLRFAFVSVCYVKALLTVKKRNFKTKQ